VIAALTAASCADSHSSTWLDDGPTPGCRNGDVTEQRYGTACLCCHEDEFSIAGSIDREGAPIVRVIVRDAEGRSVDTAPNSFGNFFGHFDLTPPLFAVVYGPNGDFISMRTAAPSGDCNGCHAEDGAAPPVHGP
jgi:hypothetical protein